MKRLLYISLAVVCCVSCLDAEIKGRIPSEEMYSTPEKIYLNAVATLYRDLGSDVESCGLQGTCRGIYDYNTLTTDEAIVPVRGGDWYDGGYWQRLYFHTWTPSDRCLYDVWKWLFGKINSCNGSLGILEEYRDTIGEDRYRNWNAEVRALRAILLWYAMDMFGNIPLPVNDAYPAAGEMVQSRRSTTFRFIFDELEYAADCLPQSRSNCRGDNYGKVTAPVVWFALAKLALNAEIYSDDDWTDSFRPAGNGILLSVDGAAMNAWEACLHYCDLITCCGYALEDLFSSNFSVNNEYSIENIFTIPADKDLYKVEWHYQFRSRHYSHGAAFGFISENGVSASLKAMETFGYGKPEPDPRLWLTFDVDEVYVDGKPVLTEDGTPLCYRPLDVKPDLTGDAYMLTAGARFSKYETDRHSYNDGKLQDNDIVLFRYSDVLLMQAEALERNGSDGSVPFNAVRDRAGAPVRECTLDNILDERLLELAWEGWRRQDLIRFGRYHQPYDMRGQLPSEADAHTTVFPIPYKCIELNPVLKQNKGYE
ncbi:MAG: RagB/SusD family nutrient uptake outer membrane protein [Candidatus Cryptobacteroides sp.]